MRPRKGSVHTLRPVGLDLSDSRVFRWTGHQVRVIQPFGCPRNGTLGHCYVETVTGQFIVLVLCASLQSIKNKRRRTCGA